MSPEADKSYPWEWSHPQDLNQRGMQPLSKPRSGTSLVVQWLRLSVSTAGGAASIPGLGTKIPHAA